MDKIQAFENLNKFIDRHNIEEELPELLAKFEQMTDNDFVECTASNQVYHKINGWSKPRVKRKHSTTPKTQTYYKLIQIDRVTEKAYGVVIGSNNMHGSNYKEFIEWIPASQIKEIDKNIYIPTWIIAKSNLWNSIDKESKINF